MLPKKLLNLLSSIVLTIMMSFCCVYALISSMDSAYPAFSVFILVLISVIVISLLFYNKTTTKISIAAIMFSVVVYLLYLAEKKLLGTVYENIAEFIEWIYNYVNYAEVLRITYMNYITILLSILVSLIVYIFTAKYFNFLIILVSGAVLFTLQWMMGYFVSYLAFYLFIFVILLYYSIFIYRKKIRDVKNNDYTSQSLFHLWLTPLCGLILLIAFLIPAKSKPIEWKWLDKKINTFVNSISDRFNYQSYEYFSLASSGFGRNNNTLGGTVNPDNTLVLTVDSPRKTYLKGTTKDIYTGFAWIAGNKDMLPIDEPESGIYLDSQEMIEGMKLLTEESNYFDKYFYRDTITITFQDLKTKSLFTPIKSSRYYFIGPKDTIVPLADSYGVLSSGRRLSKGFYYTVDAFGVKYDDDDFINIMKKSKKGFYDELLNHIDTNLRDQSEENRVIFLVPRSDGNVLTVNYDILKALSENSNKVYSQYLQIPDSLPIRITELTEIITAPYNNDYDKARAIEHYLSTNYYYTLKPAPVPEGSDFVDFFLFDSKEGYCSYYATAMTVMARSIGLPARYVEGYMLPSEPAYEDTFKVTNELAHAWVEIYFEGFGWLTFEPTSPFGNVFYTDTGITPLYSGDFVADPYYEDYLEKLEDYRERNLNRGFEPGEIGDYTYNRINYSLILRYLFMAFLLIFILNIPIRFIAVRIKYHFVKRSHGKKCVLAFYKLYLKVLALQGFVLAPGETPSVYAKRVDRLLYFGDSSFEDITNIFLKARYSPKVPDNSEKEKVSGLYKGFLKESRMNMGNLRYFLYRYILWKF